MVQKTINDFQQGIKMKKLITYLIISFCLNTIIFAEEWHVKKSENNLVKFISSTPVLDFEGRTNNIDGYIYWEGKELFGKNNEIYFEVDLNSVKTGNGKRDRDMREDVLETDRWQKTFYKGKINNVKKYKSESNKYDVTAQGSIFIHGHNKDLEINATIIIKKNLMNVTSDFSVFLKDYNIKAPSLLAFIKVAEEIKLHLNFQLKKFEEEKK